MDAKVSFMFEKRTTVIQCSIKEEMKKIFERFAQKLYSNANDFDFFYEDIKVDEDSTIFKLTDNENQREIVITAEKKVKIIKCPDCICNDAIINIGNYQITFSNCKYNHIVNKIYDNYKDSQKIDISQIKCNNTKCGINQKEFPADFYKCLKCTQLAGRTRYICSRCNQTHDKKHKTIKYDEKNYFCEKHFNKLISYCNQCKVDLCETCEKEHKSHKITKYDSINLNVKSIRDDIDKIKEKISDLSHIIEDMKDSLDGAMKIFNQYYEIAEDIIGKYELYNSKLKNHRILKSIDNLNKSNKNINEVLNEILHEKDIKIKINNLINIYNGDRLNYKEGISNQIDNNNEKNDLFNNESLDMSLNQNMYDSSVTEERGDKKKRSHRLKSKSKKNINNNNK